MKALILAFVLAFGFPAISTAPVEAATKQKVQKKKTNDQAACFRAANKLKGRRNKDAAIQACG